MSNDILVIDPSIAGVSGDMLLSSAVDLGADEKSTIDNILSIKDHFSECNKLEVNFNNVNKNGFRAKKVEIKIKEDIKDRNVKILNDKLENCIDSISLSDSAKNFIRKSFFTLIEAEKYLHGMESKKLHLHEAGSIDTFVDIIGTASAFDNLGIFNLEEIITTPVSIGGGDLSFSHGKMQNPSPAVLEIAKENELIIKGGPEKYETATPTGMAMLASLAKVSQEVFPVLKPKIIGIGAGTFEFENVQNILRLTLGEKSILLKDEVTVIETNVDDITGEELGYALQKIMSFGARDVSIIPIFGKKNRPSHLLRVITDIDKSEYFSNLIIQETGTLGVRIYPTSRYIQKREEIMLNVKINNKSEKITVKISKTESGKIIYFKPEFDQIKELAEKYNINLRKLKEDIKNQINNKLFN